MHREEKMRIRRFTPVQRIFHLLLLSSFLTQGFTGLARMYIETNWGKWLLWVIGSYERALTVHKYVGIFLICLFVAHILYLFYKVDWRRFPHCLFGPDSLVPQPVDIKHFFQHVGWLLGLIKAPQFDRWGYWEKFDYWGVFWGISVLGVTGLIMAYPLIVTRFIPGWGLNVALWIHRIEALVAMAHVFIIHFFIAHIRRHSFPMDRTMFEGSSDLTATRHEKPGWVGRLEENGKLEGLLVPVARVRVRALFYIVGYAALGLGLFLLIGGIVNSPNITW